MRQVRIDAATGQSPGPVLQADLLPLAGHLGTSLGAVDAAGQVQEAVATDAFGQPRIPRRCPNFIRRMSRPPFHG